MIFRSAYIQRPYSRLSFTARQHACAAPPPPSAQPSGPPSEPSSAVGWVAESAVCGLAARSWSQSRARQFVPTTGDFEPLRRSPSVWSVLGLPEPLASASLGSSGPATSKQVRVAALRTTLVKRPAPEAGRACGRARAPDRKPGEGEGASNRQGRQRPADRLEEIKHIADEMRQAAFAEKQPR